MSNEMDISKRITIFFLRMQAFAPGTAQKIEELKSYPVSDKENTLQMRVTGESKPLLVISGHPELKLLDGRRVIFTCRSDDKPPRTVRSQLVFNPELQQLTCTVPSPIPDNKFWSLALEMRGTPEGALLYQLL